MFARYPGIVSDWEAKRLLTCHFTVWRGGGGGTVALFFVSVSHESWESETEKKSNEKEAEAKSKRTGKELQEGAWVEG